jgi:hypothetical protein
MNGAARFERRGSSDGASRGARGIGARRARGTFFDPSFTEEVFVALEMNQTDGVRIRLPMASVAIGAIVLVGFVLLAMASWIVEATGASSSGGARTSSAAAPPNAPDPARLLEDRGRAGRRY